MSIRRFRLPPVSSALIIGKRASIGPKAMSKALNEMMPEAYTLIAVEHPVAEAIIIRSTHLRTIPVDKLVPILLERCETMMDDSDMIHVNLDIVVQASAELDL